LENSKSQFEAQLDKLKKKNKDQKEQHKELMHDKFTEISNLSSKLREL
jgi:hypothetical protein